MRRESIKNLTDEQFGFLVGSLLGDGSITKVNNETTANWVMCHSGKQLEYLLYKKKLLEDMGLPVSEPSLTHRGLYSTYTCCICLGAFGLHLRHLFYPNNNKTITRSLLNKLTPLGLAIWYQDDGSRRFIKRGGEIQGREIKIATNGFSLEEHEIIKNYFDVVWNIQWRVNRDRQYYTLVTAATNANKFISVIKPYVCSQLNYKIDLMYKRQSPQVTSVITEDGIVWTTDINKTVEVAEMTTPCIEVQE